MVPIRVGVLLPMVIRGLHGVVPVDTGGWFMLTVARGLVLVLILIFRGGTVVVLKGLCGCS